MARGPSRANGLVILDAACYLEPVLSRVEGASEGDMLRCMSLFFFGE
jgi:hypothetical protein